MVYLQLQGWGIVLELAAGRVMDPMGWVGLAANKPNRSVGLAATVEELTGYIWIGLL
jgi:hypothetical protein